MSDLFGVTGRQWLADQPFPIAGQPEVRRLMTVPGVNVIVAATFMAAVGDIGRFPDRRKLVGYLGLDPRVRQLGASPANHGRISKQGSSSARHALVEASWSTVRQPGPIAGFYLRVKARRGHSIAIVAAARKLACLFWCLLTRGEDYAVAQPSLTKKKMRRLELPAGAPKGQGGRSVWSTNDAMRAAERELALQAQRAEPNGRGLAANRRERDSGPRIKWLLEATSRAADLKAPSLHFDTSSLAPLQMSHDRW
jgi:hypothetical protein